MRLRMSMKFMARSSKLASGCSYITHMIFAASIGEPPPSAMMTSGPNARICLTPSCAHCSVGSGATSQKQALIMPIWLSFSSMGLT